MRSDRKQTILFVIILLVLGMGIGYAFLTTTLNIDGVSDIDSAVWDIHFENLYIDEFYTYCDTEVYTPATIGNNGTTISYAIKLNTPGDFYAFTVDAVNDGTLDAIIDNVSIKVNGVEDNFPDYLKYELYYDSRIADGELLPGRFLRAGTSEKYGFTIYYDYLVTADDLPTESETLSISIDISYSQLVRNPFSNGEYAYTISDDISYVVGNSLPNNGDYYDDYQIPLANYSSFNFLRHHLENNVITYSEMGIYYKGNIYYLRGGAGNSRYNTNKQILNNIFGSEYGFDCQERTNISDCDDYPNCEEITSYSCSYDSSMTVSVHDDGEIYSRSGVASCTIYGDSSSECEILPGL